MLKAMNTTKNDAKTLSRSPELMSHYDTVLVIVDVQEKLMPLIPGWKRIMWNLRRLVDGADAVGLKVLATEQSPRPRAHYARTGRPTGHDTQQIHV